MKTRPCGVSGLYLWFKPLHHPSSINPSLNSAIQTFLQQGFLKCQQAISPAQIARWSAAYHARFGEHQHPEQYGFYVGDRRLLHPLPLEGPFADPFFYACAPLRELLTALLGVQCVLNNCSVVVSFPGAKDQHLHRDAPFLFGRHPASVGAPPYAITVGIPLLPLTPDTGCTRFYTGSHQHPLPPEHFEKSTQTQQSYGDCGDIYLMDFRMVHKGTANPGRLQRPIIYLAYSQNWYFDIVNTAQHQVPSVVIDDVQLQAVPEKYRQLLSYAHLLPRQLKPYWQDFYRAENRPGL